MTVVCHHCGFETHAYYVLVAAGPDDWSWRLRYLALQNLSTICQSSDEYSLKDGQRAVLRNAVERACSLETDARVTEAAKACCVRL
jgi:hypothetical protein